MTVCDYVEVQCWNHRAAAGGFLQKETCNQAFLILYSTCLLFCHALTIVKPGFFLASKALHSGVCVTQSASSAWFNVWTLTSDCMTSRVHKYPRYKKPMICCSVQVALRKTGSPPVYI